MIEIKYTGDALWERIERVMEDARTLPFERLVTMKLTSYRRKDQVHLLDMISIGLLDESWLERLVTRTASTIGGTAQRSRRLISDIPFDHGCAQRTYPLTGIAPIQVIGSRLLQ